METKHIILILILILSTFPISHLLYNRGMVLDNKLTENKVKNLSKYFYIPFLNIVVYLLYLIWNIATFKRSE